MTKRMFTHAVFAPLSLLFLMPFDRFIDDCSRYTTSVHSPSSRIEPLELFPNPTTGVVNLKNLRPGATVTVIDVNGKLIRRLSSPASPLRLGGLTASIYIIQVVNTDRTGQIGRVVVR